ncbi:hypothetical protein BU15DRAFT_60508 [Melanogaster broomeanus]|nr:hypothetical protein BU15DRAFT_60508 [Melanogaster broomeanus]
MSTICKSQCTRKPTEKASAGQSHSSHPKNSHSRPLKMKAVTSKKGKKHAQSITEEEPMTDSDKETSGTQAFTTEFPSPSIEIEDIELPSRGTSVTQDGDDTEEAGGGDEGGEDDDEGGNNDLDDQHHAPMPLMVISKKKQAEDLLTIFSYLCSVKFCHPDGRVETLKGCWCNECRQDKDYIVKHGKRKAFHVGSNLSCRQ